MKVSETLGNIVVGILLWVGAMYLFSSKAEKEEYKKWFFGPKYSFNTEANAYWKFPILPFTINIGSGGISLDGDLSIVTPLGVFGANVSVNVDQRPIKVNNVAIEEEDFVVILIDNKTHTKSLYKIKGRNKLKVVLNAKTEITAQQGLVEINITQSNIEHISFIDQSCIKIKNSSPTKLCYRVCDKTDNCQDYCLEPNYYQTFSSTNDFKETQVEISTVDLSGKSINSTHYSISGGCSYEIKSENGINLLYEMNECN